MSRRALPVLFALLVPCFAPGLAWAGGGTVAVPPLVPKGVDPKVSTNLTGLISSELDFSGAFETVSEIPAPATLNLQCLSTTACLAGIAKGAGAEAVLAGSVGPGPSGLQIYMVLYDATKGTIKNKKTFNVAADPSSLADNAGRWVKELVSGQAPAEVAATEAPKADAFASADPEEEFEFDKAAPAKAAVKTRIDPAASAPRRDLEDEMSEADILAEHEAEKRIAAEEAARAKAEAKARADAEAKARAAAEAKARADAEARARADAEAKARAEAARLAREEDERRQAELEARRAAEEKRLALEQADLEAKIARQEAEAVAKAKAAAAARAKTAPSKPAPAVVDDEEFEFGSSASLIAIEMEEEEEEPEPVVRSAPSRSSSASRSDDEEEDVRTARSYDEDESLDLDEDEPERDLAEEEEEEEEILDLDEDRPSRSASKSSSTASKSSAAPTRSSSSRSSPSSKSSSTSKSTRELDDPEKPGIHVAGRIGYSRFFAFNFVTYGAELNVPVTPSFAVVAGIEGFSTQRHLGEKEVEQIAKEADVAVETVNPDPWNTILPVNAGVLYKHPGSSVRPYAGLDLTLTPYTADFDIAFGARARAGADFMIAKNFGLNLNVAVGVMSGSEFDTTQQDVGDFGLIPQISGGTVLEF